MSSTPKPEHVEAFDFNRLVHCSMRVETGRPPKPELAATCIGAVKAMYPFPNTPWDWHIYSVGVVSGVNVEYK